MRIPELAGRYAKALYEIAVDNKTQDKVFANLRELEQIFARDPEISAFFQSPLIKTEDRVRVLETAFQNKGLVKEVYDLILLLARNNRLPIFGDVVLAYQSECDTANNVARGTVRSAMALGQGERQRIEETVERVLSKKVILTYKVDPSVIGGLVAQVGSYTFDDSIASHLKRMNEELKRRTV